MKFVFPFNQNDCEGDGSRKMLLGGKGANLADMVKLGLPVPPGFTISTEVCAHFYQNQRSYPSELKAQVENAVAEMEKALSATGMRFGDAKNPLLVSVRSGAPVSMPGMMDTVLNLGLNDATVLGLIGKSGNPRFGWDSYRRFIMMYSDVVMSVNSSLFETALEDMKAEAGVELDTELTAEQLKALVKKFKMITVEQSGRKFPEDPMEQLWGAIGAVFGSWMNPRAITYRKINAIPEEYGTAVTVQAMVYGNMGEDCATGVAFTRDPSTGRKVFFGEFMTNAQGEDVVAGIRTPQPVNAESLNDSNKHLPTMEKAMPGVYADLVALYQRLETHYRDMQDIEFTVQRNKLFMLQTRSGKRTAAAAVKIAVDMVKEGLISKKDAVARVTPEQLDQLLHPRLDPSVQKDVIARGLPASPGAATGRIVFDPDVAEKWVKDKNEKVILVRVETSPEDIHGMHVAQGILTARGGMTSHAAVVARGMGKCCVAGCGALKVLYGEGKFLVGNREFKEGDWLTLDGTSGEVIAGKVDTVIPDLTDDFHEFMAWVDEFRRLKIRANADTPNDSRMARNFGAEGIGLCRTEHMFFEPDRIGAVRQMILADTLAGRERALAKLLPMQRGDFLGIFREMKGLPVTIRLLDPPLHEFLPHKEEDVVALAREMEVSLDSLLRRRETLHEFNPMLGHRGCRLGISYPEIYRMQVRAIVEAACELKKKNHQAVEPEIMVPLVGHWKELRFVRDYCEDEIRKVFSEQGVTVPYSIGTMIELPRAALTADQIADQAKGDAAFFSFGTNDLTQTTFGLSRDDAGVFLGDYIDRKVYAADPFVSIDRDGVGELMKMAGAKGRGKKPGMKIGICGEHGGEARSVHFCHEIGLDYVSCSPFRVPIARLAAAQAAIEKIK
ncbi:MAG: pyruvate, phosphate dikinase [Bdellovibrionales bacterium]|nr:pyruvate, phosphate dikinase [Bdellovibrionales bacterium]